MLVRNTKSKELVASIFRNNSTPLMIDEVHQQVQKILPKTAYSTTYRIIQRYKAEGKLISVDWRERGSRYEWADKHHHHHLVCNTCGTVSDIDDNTINFEANEITKKTGFVVEDHLIELFGECAPCREGSQ